MKKTTVVCVITFALSSFANYPEQSQAQLIAQTSSISSSKQNSNLPPAAEDAPGGRKGGTGSRSEECSISSSEKKINLTLTAQPSASYIMSDSPNIKINVKYEADEVENVISGKLVLEEEDTNRKLDSIDFELPKNSSDFSIPLPKDFDLNKKYHWYLEFQECEIELK